MVSHLHLDKNPIKKSKKKKKNFFIMHVNIDVFSCQKKFNKVDVTFFTSNIQRRPI